MLLGDVDLAQHPHAAQFLQGRLQDVTAEIDCRPSLLCRLENQAHRLAAIAFKDGNQILCRQRAIQSLRRQSRGQSGRLAVELIQGQVEAVGCRRRQVCGELFGQNATKALQLCAKQIGRNVSGLQRRSRPADLVDKQLRPIQRDSDRQVRNPCAQHVLPAAKLCRGRFFGGSRIVRRRFDGGIARKSARPAPEDLSENLSCFCHGSHGDGRSFGCAGGVPDSDALRLASSNWRSRISPRRAWVFTVPSGNLVVSAIS